MFNMHTVTPASEVKHTWPTCRMCIIIIASPMIKKTLQAKGQVSILYILCSYNYIHADLPGNSVNPVLTKCRQRAQF